MVNKLYPHTQLVTGFSVCYSSMWAGNQGLWCISKTSSMEKTKLNTRIPQHFNWEKRPHSRWNSPGQNTGVGSIPLLQGIFPRQGSNPGLPHCWQILYQLSHKGSPLILEWGSLSLLQQILLTQELNQGPLHCRQILYQLSSQGSPSI